MTTVINDIGAFYLGNDFSNISGLSNQVFSPDGSVGRVVTDAGFVYKADEKIALPTHPVSVYNQKRDAQEREDTWVTHDVAGGSNDPGQRLDPLQVERVVVTFNTPDGSIPANMWVMRLEDGTSFMVPDHPSTGGFMDYEDTVQGKEILSFSIGTVNGISSEAMTPPLNPWTGGAFPEPEPNEAPTANDDNRTVDYDFYEADANGIIGIRNVLTNDTDPNADTLTVVSAGGDTTPNSAGWFDWIDASNGGQIRVNVDGRSQFRGGEVFENLPQGQSVTTSIEYTVTDPDGATSTATVSLTMQGTAAAPVLTITAAPGTPTDPDTGNPLTSENGAPAQIVITRSGPTTEALVVTLTDGDPSETNAPATVTIPAGASSVTVEIPSVDDTIVDGDQVSIITASAPGYVPASQAVTVADDDVDPNGIVDGENTGEVMNPEYDDGNAPTDSGGDLIDGADGINDVILGNGGDDVINAGLGNDEVYGGSGNDVIEGGAGNDVITGDFADGVSDVVVDSGTAPGDDTLHGGDGDDIIYGDSNDAAAEIGTRTFDFGAGNTQTFGGVTASWQPDDIGGDDGVSFPVYIGELPDSYTGGASRTENAWRSSLDNNGQGSQSHRWDFGGQDVEGFAVVIGGIQTGETVNISGFNAAGDLVTATVVVGEALTLNSSSSGSFGVTNNEPFGAGIQNPATTFTYMANEPLTWVQITHFGDNSVWISPAYFGAGVDEVPTDGIGGDDVIKGGLGADQMFGEGGDDTFLVGSAEEGAGDVVTGGNGPDDTTDNDVLDLRGAGVVEIASADDLTDAGALTGTVRFKDGTTLDFSQIETILQDDPALTIEPGPNETIDPDTGLPVTQENGAPVELVVTRNTPTTEDLVVTIQNGDPSELNPPVTVTIPAGQDSVSFFVDPVDDPLVDGDQIAPITVTAPGLAPATQEVLVEDDDTPALTIEPGPNETIDPDTGLPVTQENGAPVELVVTRNTPTTEDLVVTIQNGDPSELNPPVTVTIPAGQDSVSFFVDPVDDPLVDGDQIAPITVTAPGLAPATQEVLVEDDDTPALTIEPGPNETIDPDTGLPVTQENGAPVELVVTRNTPTTEDLVVTIQNGDPSELNPPVTVTIPAGQDSVSFFVDPVDDPLVDGDQIAPITVTAPGLAPATQEVLVEDDDTPALTIEPGPNETIDPDTGLPVTQENGAPVELVVTRNTPTTEDLVVTIQNGDPSELNPPVTVTIPAGQDSVSFFVDPVDDPLVDGDQIAPITVTAPGLAPATQEVLVEDDDTPALTIEPGPNETIDPDTGLPVTQENGAPVELVVTRNTPTTEDLVVTIQNGDPSELNPPVTVTIPAGQDSVSFFVDPVDDPLVDGDQIAPITVTAPGLAPATQEVLVEDDDTPALTIEPGPNETIDPDTGLPVTQENGAPVELVVTRNTPTTEDLVVTIQNGDPSELNPPVTVTIPAGQDSVSFFVDPVDDPLVDGDQIAPITVTAPGLAPATQEVLVEDDDTPALTIEPGPNETIDPDTGLPVTQENGAPVELVVTRNTPTTEDLVVTIQNGDPSELNPPVTVTIPAGQDSVSFFVDPVDDPLVDGDQIAPITVTAPGLAPATQEVLVEDDDTPALTIEPGPNETIDPDTGLPVTQENGAPVELVVTRNTPTTEDLVVTIQNGDPSELNPPVTVTIPAGQDSVSFFVDPVDDPLVDGDQIAPITVTAPGLAPATQEVLVEDDDTPALTIEPGPNETIDPDTGLPVTQENGAPVELVVTRNTPTTEDLVVTIQNGDPSELNPPVTVTIPAGQDSVSFFIDPVDDPLVDGDQIAPITVTAPGLAPATQEVLVEDDDTPALTIEPGPNETIDPDTGLPVTQENGAPVELVVTRNTPTTEDLVVTIQNGDPSELNPPVTVTIPAGQDSVSFFVDPVDDPLVDGDQIAPITVTAPGLAPATQEVLVEDDDVFTPTITVTTPNAALDAEGRPILTEGGDPVDFVITRDGPLDQPLVLQLTSDDTSEATVPEFVTILPGQTSVTVPVTPVDDDLIDGDQFPVITVTPFGSSIAPVSVEAVVQDDDAFTPTITVTFPDATLDAEGRPILTEGGDPVDFVVTRDGPLDQPLVLQVTSGDETEATVPQFVFFAPGQDTVTVPVTPVDDDLIDGDQFPVITLTPLGSDIAPVSVEAVVQDDDVFTPTITVTFPDATLDAEGRPILTEGGDPVDFVVTRDGPLDEFLVLQVSSGDETEATVPQFVFFAPGQDTVTVPVTPVDDDLIDGDQFPVITLTPLGSDIAPVSVEAVVQDDDVFTPTITVTFPDATLDAEGRPILTEGGDPVDFVVTRDGPLDEFLVLQVSSGDTTEATVPQFVFFAPGQDTVTVPVTPVDDDLIDGDQFPVITLTPLGSDIAPVSVEAVVQDDDSQQGFAPVAGDDNANTAVNTPVLIDVLANDVDPDGDDALLQITDASIVSGGGTVQVIGDQLFYIPQTGFTGSVELTYEITDEQGLTDTAIVNLHVNGPNTAPDAVNDLGIVGTNAIDNGLAVELGNVLLNDSDPDGDTFVFAALGTDDTPDAEGFFGWVDGSNGGEIRVNQDGSFEFRDLDGDFAALQPDELAITSVDYTIVDAFGAEDTATISVKVIGEYDDCGCGGGTPTPPDFLF